MMYAYFLFGVLVLVIDVVALAQKYTFLDKEQGYRLKDLQWSFTEPAIVNNDGSFLTHILHHEASPLALHRSRRDTESLSDRIIYRLTLPDSQQPIHVVVEPNTQLYSPNLVIEERFSNMSHQSTPALPSPVPMSHCYYTGHIKGDASSKVAISTCNGLTGMLMTADAHYFIEPVKGHEINPSRPHPHVIYKAANHVSGSSTLSEASSAEEAFCSEHRVDHQREHNSKRSTKKRRRKRSFSNDYFVETLVVVDHSMVEYYKDEDINTYIFTIMNMVSILFHDASIGNSININVVKLLLLDDAQAKKEGLSVTHHADKTLDSFCKWQKSLNPREPDAGHHDVAILITRLDICSRMNEPCSTLGLAQVSGMCQPGRSCNVNEDTGLALAYTIAHELGHNFGMKHDGFNDCSMPTGEKSYIMFPEFLVDAGRPLIWSNCSREAVTRFLDRGWGFCLEDEPEKVYHYPYPDKPPGVLYDVSHQCRLQYGSQADHCSGIENMCITLWCSVNGRCVSRLEPAAEGTICEWENNTETGVPIPKKWCFDAECVEINTRPKAINGGWGDWTEWTACSRTCGGGVSISERHCTNPVPSNGGKYCIGERKKYKICETGSCPSDEPSFREEQCAEYNQQPYKSVLYQWEPISTNNPCQLNCKPKNRYFSVMLNDMANDGTPCLPGTRNLCITGACRKVGCDWKLESNATEDRCGICHGDGSSCKTVKDQFKGQPPEDQGYVEAAVIPSGARNIRIEEVAEANNYLAVKSEGDEYYLNGHWYIQWTGNYNMAGTTVHYERLGNKEGITAPGPIKEPLHIMLLFQSHNPGVKFEYTVPNQNGTTNDTRIPEFHWVFLDWSPCTVSCGGGYQRKKVVCMEKVAGLVEDKYCFNTTKPDDKAKSCNEHLCPARWWIGPWQHCSVSCGTGGTRHRTVLCVRSLGPEEQMALEDEDCKFVPKPKTQEPCKRKPPPCPSLWRAGPWSECRDVCDVRTREVICTATNSSSCVEEVPPISQKPCRRQVVCGHWETGTWSKCTKSCGEGVMHRMVECKRGDHCRRADRPDDIVPCSNFACNSRGAVDQPVNRVRHNRFDLNEQHQRKPRPVNLGSDDDRTVQNSTNPKKPNMWSRLWWYMLGHKDSNKHNMVLKPTTTAAPTPPTYTGSWHAAEWSSCTATCGTGQKTREIWCPTKGTCDPTEKPSQVVECMTQPCLSWAAGSWSQCSVTCGNGTQRRNVQCINLESDQAVAGCDQHDKPSAQRKCSKDKCNTVSAALRSSAFNKKCEKDILAADTCQQLKNRGFCTFKYVSRNCCKLCKTAGR